MLESSTTQRKDLFGLLITAALAEGTTKQTGKFLVEDAMQNVSVNTQLRRVVFGKKKKKGNPNT